MAIVRSIARSVAQPVARPLTGSDGGPPQAPIISSVTISGDTRVGDVLSSSISYTQAPRPGGTPSYQWQRDAVDIAGATSSTYTLVAADAGAAITLVFSITNSEGSDGPVTSNTINADALAVPVITGVPTISGTADVGEVLTATAASVSGNPPPSTTWQWERDGTPIGGATSSTYTVVLADENAAITVVQTETNTQGSDTAESAATTITAAPSISGVPTLSGTEAVGSTLTATAASVTGTPTPTRSFQWQRSSDGSTGWADISGATSSTYELVSADEDNYVRAVQTETNTEGTDTANSAASGQIAASGGSGTLPLDGVTSAVHALSASGKLLTAYTGDICRVRRAADSATADVAPDGNDITLDSAVTIVSGSSSATTLGQFVAAAGYSNPDSLGAASDAFVVTSFDQIGSADATQASAAAQPKIITAGVLETISTRTAMLCSGSQALGHSYPGSTGIRDDHAMLAVVRPSALQSGFRGIYSTSSPTGGLMLLSRLGTLPQWGTYSGSERPSGTTLAVSTAYLLSMERTGGGTGAFRTNGSADGTYGATEGQATAHWGGLLGAQGFAGHAGDAVLCTDAADRATVESRLLARWGL